MKVLLWMIGGEAPGGHRIQIEQTTSHLRAMGLDCEMAVDGIADVASYDLVHGFGLSPESIRKCRLAGVPVVLSTIYWSRAYTTGTHAHRGALASLQNRARMGFVLLRSAMLGLHIEKCEAMVERLQRTRVAFEMADLLLPNSKAEASQIDFDLGVTTPMEVVPNAVDDKSFTLPDSSHERSGVLYVGRFEPHKNQLGLLRALRGSDIPLTLAGPPHPDHPEYHAQCLREGGANVQIIPAVPHDQLPALYQKFKVHVLPSWFESTGLVSLEAALCGCNVVTTSRGYAGEYFGNFAWYCDPANDASIRKAVGQAYAAPFKQVLRERILANYTWKHTARATAAAYDHVMRRATPCGLELVSPASTAHTPNSSCRRLGEACKQ
jgi:glycosyltransferase involved in cell wall biosynthesis